MFSLFNFSSIFQGGQLTPFAPMCGRPRKRIDEHWPVGVVDGPVNGALVALEEHALAARVAVGGRRQRLCHPARHPHLLLDRRVRLRLVVVERRVRVLCVHGAPTHIDIAGRECLSCCSSKGVEWPAKRCYVGLVAVGVQEQAEDILVPPLLRNCLTFNYTPLS